jgi:hypothetical protein
VAVRQRGLRRIVVDGVAYRWKFPRPTSASVDGWSFVYVLREQPAGSLLRVGFLGRWHQSGPCPSGLPVLPFDVAAAVRAALASGWRADQPGGVHRHWVSFPDAEPGNEQRHAEPLYGPANLNNVNPDHTREEPGA